MKKTILVSLFVLIAGLGSGFLARAQYVPQQIEQKKGRLIDDRGEVMPDFMVERLVGEDIFHETYEGARKQYKTGKILLSSSFAVMGAGAVMSGVSLGVFISDYIKIFGGTQNIWDSFSGAKDSVSWFYRGFAIIGAGYTLFSAGLIVKTVGWKRLEWVADNYNQNQRPATLRFGAGQYGTGLVLNF